MGFLKKFNDTRIGFKLTAAFFFIAFLSIVVIGYLSYVKGKSSLEEESFNRLTAVREMKASQIEGYFQDIRNQIITFSEEHTIVDAMVDFKIGFDTVSQQSNYSDQELQACHTRLEDYYKNEFLPRLNTDTLISSSIENHWPSHESAVILQDLYISKNENPVGRKHYLNRAERENYYTKAHAEYHPLIRSYLEKFDYYDIFLVDNETGHIVYSVYKEVDFATSLIDGPYANSNIAKAFNASQKASDSNFVQLVDFTPYIPSYNAPAAFISTPIFHNGENVGTLIFQMPIKRIDDIMTSRHEWAEVGLGKSGETYIVANDFTLRNQSRFLIEDRKNYLKMIEEIGTPKSIIDQIVTFESTVGLQEVKTVGTKAALAGKTNTEIFKDYRGVEVLSSYKPLDIEGMRWVIMSEIDKDEAFAHVYDLRNNIIVIFFGLLISITIASLFISRKITKPLKQLTQRAEELADGDLDVEIDPRGGDEIGTLSKSFIHMQHSISDLVHNLEDKVEARTSELKERNVVIEEKNREIVDSINYALRLQKAIIPTESRIKSVFPKSLVYYKPKDIVSGDFYWMSENKGKIIIGAIDCTGHGVPGAIVSVVGANGLNRCVKEFDLVEPADILDRLSVLVQETFESGEDKVKDGMDGALCTFDLSTNKISYAGAHNPLWIVRKDAQEIEEIKANKQPIGNFEFAQEFTNHEVQLNEGDTIFIFSDGYVDQFGGPKGKKFKYKSLKNLLIENKDKNMDELYEVLDSTFLSWKGDLEQLDDVCLIGIRI